MAFLRYYTRVQQCEVGTIRTLRQPSTIGRQRLDLDQRSRVFRSHDDERDCLFRDYPAQASAPSMRLLRSPPPSMWRGSLIGVPGKGCLGDVLSCDDPGRVALLRKGLIADPSKPSGPIDPDQRPNDTERMVKLDDGGFHEANQSNAGGPGCCRFRLRDDGIDGMVDRCRSSATLPSWRFYDLSIRRYSR